MPVFFLIVITHAKRIKTRYFLVTCLLRSYEQQLQVLQNKCCVFYYGTEIGLDH